MINASMVKELRELTEAGMMDCKKALEECGGDIKKAQKWLKENGLLKVAKKESRIAAEGLASIYVSGNNALILELNCETDFVSKNPEFKELVDTFGNTILKSKVASLEEALELKSGATSLNDLLVEKTVKIGEKLSFRRFLRFVKKENQVFGSYIHLGGKIAALTILEGATEEVAKDVAMQGAAMKPIYLEIAAISGDIIDELKESFKKEALNEGKPANIIDKMVEGKLKKYYQENCLSEQLYIKDDSMKISEYVSKNKGVIISMERFEVGEGMSKRSEDFATEVMNQLK